MTHRIQLSTTLLIAIKTTKRKTGNSKPRVAGITITAKSASLPEKGHHAVDELGNIIPAVRRQEFAA